MLQKVFQLIDKIHSFEVVYAHCDIPCGIYDPHNMQMAAHTVLRMINLIQEAKAEGLDEKEFVHQIARYTKTKEEHAELVKYELRVLWGDYFKDEHAKEYPELNDLVWKTLKLASKVRQSMDSETAQQLLENTQKIAGIFYKTKGMEPVRIASGYPTGGEIVSHR